MKGLVTWKAWPVGPWLGTAEPKAKVVAVLRASGPLVRWLEVHVGASDLSRSPGTDRVKVTQSSGQDVMRSRPAQELESGGAERLRIVETGRFFCSRLITQRGTTSLR